jgi:hypothetical protein
VKLTFKIFEKNDGDAKQRRPLSHLFGGRVRTSTLVLIVAFLALWWTYDTYRPQPAPKPSAPQVVPPGFVPDPNYTWVPRSRVQQPPADTYTPRPTPIPTPTTTLPPPPVTTTTTTPPPFVLPTLPCIPPFCTPSTTPTPSPPPGPGPVPTPVPPAS